MSGKNSYALYLLVQGINKSNENRLQSVISLYVFPVYFTTIIIPPYIYSYKTVITRGNSKFLKTKRNFHQRKRYPTNTHVLVSYLARIGANQTFIHSSKTAFPSSLHYSRYVNTAHKCLSHWHRNITDPYHASFD